MPDYLPVRESPLSGESLTGYLRRHTVAMGYDSLRQLLSLLDQIQFPPHLDHLHTGRALTALANLLRRDERALIDLTVHRWATQIVFRERVAADPVNCDSKTLRRFFNASRPRVCPKCLEQSPSHDRIIWSFRPLGICREHGDVLLEWCPGCRRSFSRARLDLLRCHCGFVLTEEPPRSVHGRALEMARLIATWLESSKFATVELPTSAGFWWLDRLRFAVVRVPKWCSQVRKEWGVSDALPQDSFCWLAAAWIIQASPDDLTSFLAAYRIVDRHRLTPSRAGRYFGLLLRDANQLERFGYPVASNTCASIAASYRSHAIT